LYAAARAIVGAGGETQARDLADSLYAELYGMGRDDADRTAVDRSASNIAEPDRGNPDRAGRNRKPLLQYFHGRSKLSTWLRAVLAQKFVDSLRATQRFHPLDEEREQHAHTRNSTASGSSVISDACDIAAGDPDRQRLIPHLREAFTESLAALTPTDRLLLSLYYVQELSLAQIAKLRGVHEATISRQLDRLRRELRESVERMLSAARPQESDRAGRAALSTAEIRLCFTYALEDWALDLGNHLPNTAQTGSSGRNTGET
jgi:RNA polymerase sigma factor (sigma-70 family)